MVKQHSSSDLILNPTTYNFMMIWMQQADLMRLVIERWVRITSQWWNEDVVLRIVKQIIISSSHASNKPAIESHRSLIFELARNVIISQILHFENSDSVDPAGALELLWYMHKITDEECYQLEFRTRVRLCVERKCVRCDRIVRSDMSGGRCGRCTVTNYCSQECQKKDYKKHWKLCVAWDNWRCHPDAVSL